MAESWISVVGIFDNILNLKMKIFLWFINEIKFKDTHNYWDLLDFNTKEKEDPFKAISLGMTIYYSNEPWISFELNNICHGW